MSSRRSGARLLTCVQVVQLCWDVVNAQLIQAEGKVAQALLGGVCAAAAAAAGPAQGKSVLHSVQRCTRFKLQSWNLDMCPHIQASCQLTP